ncbi:hypothetical protein M9H77_18651 [Catharanthus roseus]|uniref:Uncharacterized protein n=1 Tax=Catharanthus roseus TaxID=4058 RepID=A0ACC0B8B7_CATRO|nr:hypothetical protein M9H77_18651 [Catharanthus roseus]
MIGLLGQDNSQWRDCMGWTEIRRRKYVCCGLGDWSHGIGLRVRGGGTRVGGCGQSEKRIHISRLNRWGHNSGPRQAPMDVKLRPLARALAKKLKIHEANEADGMVAFMEKALKYNLEGFEDQGKASKFIDKEHPTVNGSLAPAVTSRLLPAYHLEEHPNSSGRSHPTIAGRLGGGRFFIKGGNFGKEWNPIYNKKRMYIKVVSEQPPNEGLIISTDGQLPTQSHQEDVEELKKGKSSATIEQRVRDKLGGFNSPHHQRSFDNVSTYGYHDMPVQNSYPFHEDGYQGRPQVRGGRREV